MELPKDIQARIAAIAADNTHGAFELTKQAAEVVLQLAKHESSGAVVAEQVRAAVRALVTAQPMMASLVTLASEVLQSIDGISQPEETVSALQASAERFRERLKENVSLAANNASQLIRNGWTVLTHSSSSSVYQAFESAQHEGKNFRVTCTESRPIGEGIVLAQKLGTLGIPTRLLVDSAAFTVLSEVHMILVGGDAVTLQGLVNKIGTYGLAIAARESKIPFYAVCDTTKFLPSDYALPQERERNPDEVLAIPLTGISVLNYYFDQTPLKLLTGIVTEEGVRSIPQVEERFANIHLHPELTSSH